MSANIVERERERERVNNSYAGESVASEHVSWKICLSLVSILLAIVGVILYCGFKNIAAATQQDVTFNPVTIQNRARIHVNGDKTLTAIDGGNRLVADNTNGILVKDDQIESELTSFAGNNYGEDELFKKNVANNPACLRITDVSSLLPSVNYDYWLAEKGLKGKIRWHAYSTKNNYILNNNLIVSGSDGEQDFYYERIVNGPYALSSDVKLSNFYKDFTGGEWSRIPYLYSNSSLVTGFSVCYTDKSWLHNGAIVYNSPTCRTDTTWGDGFPYVSSLIQNLAMGSDKKVFGWVRPNSSTVVKSKLGDKYPAGTVLVFGFMRSQNEIKDPSYFVRSDVYGGHAVNSYIGFVKTPVDVTVVAKSSETQNLFGFGDYTEEPTLVNGDNIVGATKSVRPSFDLNMSKVAFLRAFDSGSTLKTSNKVGNNIISIGYANANYKTVIRSNECSILNNISSDNISVDENDTSPSYSENKITIPYNSKILKFKSGSFRCENAKYISILCENGELKKQAVIGEVNSDLNIDLSSIIDTSQVGSRTPVTFYAENPHDAFTTDEISSNFVSVEIEVVGAEEQAISYDLDGGQGFAINSSIMKAGHSYKVGDGFGLSKDGNLFSKWIMSYSESDKTDITSRMIESNETIIVPRTSDGKIKFTALYAGVKASKATDTEPFKAVVTWNSNAPDGYTATFDSVAGVYNDERTLRYDTVRVKGASVVVPSKPVLEPSTKIFAGWYDQPTGGNKVDGAVNASRNITYFAHWKDISFLGVASDTPGNPMELGGETISLSELKAAAKDIALNGEQSVYYLQYQTYMKNDSMHLYTLLKGDNEDFLNIEEADNWAEFRIVHVGQHDNDGSGLTFQMTHCLTDEYFFDSANHEGIEFNWGNSSLRSLMQENGSIFNRFNAELINNIKAVKRKYNDNSTSNRPNLDNVNEIEDMFSIISLTEMSIPSGYYWGGADFGSIFDFWKLLNVPISGISGNSKISKLSCTRTGVQKGIRSGTSYSPETGSVEYSYGTSPFRTVIGNEITFSNSDGLIIYVGSPNDNVVGVSLLFSM